MIVDRIETYEEGDEDRSIHHEKSKQCRPSVSQSVGDRASKEHTNECTALSGLEKR